MAQTNHYTTVDIRVYSDDTDTEAIIWVAETVSGRILARMFCYAEADAQLKLDDGTIIADDAQALIDTPPSPIDWTPGKTGIAGLPTV